jgi:hypothetical protein
MTVLTPTRVVDLAADQATSARDLLDQHRSEAADVVADATQAVQDLDVPKRLEAGWQMAEQSIRDAIGQLPGQRRDRRPWGRLVQVLLAALVVASVAMWLKRRAGAATADEADQRFDDEAVERAANEGMSAVSVA